MRKIIVATVSLVLVTAVSAFAGEERSSNVEPCPNGGCRFINQNREPASVEVRDDSSPASSSSPSDQTGGKAAVSSPTVPSVPIGTSVSVPVGETQ